MTSLSGMRETKETWLNPALAVHAWQEITHIALQWLSFDKAMRMSYRLSLGRDIRRVID